MKKGYWTVGNGDGLGFVLELSNRVFVDEIGAYCSFYASEVIHVRTVPPYHRMSGSLKCQRCFCHAQMRIVN